MIVTANPEIVMTAKDDPSYREIINNVADYVTADGIGIVKAARMLGKRLPERVTGYDLFTWFLDTANQDKLRVYLIGAKPEVIQAVEKRLRASTQTSTLLAARTAISRIP